LLIHLLTRIYFPGDAANADDPVLTLVPPARRQTLVARKTADGLEWDVILQGDHETVFFSY
jgi:protocatechuate 3,4-dioxygenase alpha subunit